MIDLDHTSLDRVLPSTPGSADWDDVLSRSGAQRRRHRLLVVLAAVALVVVGTASASEDVRDFLFDGGLIGMGSDRPATPDAPQSGELVVDSSQASAKMAVVSVVRVSGVPVGTASVVNADGSGQQRLAYGTRPLWSPDGEKIAFFRRGPIVGGLYVMNADGSGQRRLARDDVWVAAWSPA